MFEQTCNRTPEVILPMQRLLTSEVKSGQPVYTIDARMRTRKLINRTKAQYYNNDMGMYMYIYGELRQHRLLTDFQIQ